MPVSTPVRIVFVAREARIYSNGDLSERVRDERFPVPCPPGSRSDDSLAFRLAFGCSSAIATL